MQYQIGTQCEWVLKGRTEERIIHYTYRSRIPCELTNFRNIDNAQQWIAWTFHQNQLRFLCQGLFQRLFVVLIDKQDAIAAAFRQAVKQAIAAAVAVVRRNQQIAGFQEHRGHQVNGGHPRIG